MVLNVQCSKVYINPFLITILHCRRLYCNALRIALVQITYNLNGPRISHTCDKCGVNHTRVGFLDSTRSIYTCVYVHAHTMFIHACVFTCVHACMASCMANVASWLASYILFSLSYNATVFVTLFLQDLGCKSRGGR